MPATAISCNRIPTGQNSGGVEAIQFFGQYMAKYFWGDNGGAKGTAVLAHVMSKA
jgi:hypothetical protein